jgi:hypothetical protein
MDGLGWPFQVESTLFFFVFFESQAAGRKSYKNNGLGKFTKAVMEARKQLKITGFQCIGKIYVPNIIAMLLFR